MPSVSRAERSPRAEIMRPANLNSERIEEEGGHGASRVPRNHAKFEAKSATGALAVARQGIPLLAMLFLWEVASFLLGDERLPGIYTTITNMVNSALSDPLITAQEGSARGFLTHVGSTARAFGLGLSLGCVAGVGVTLLLATMPSLHRLLSPVIEALRILPPLLLIPLALVLVSNPAQIPIATVAAYTGMILIVYGLSALRNIPRSYVQLGKLLGTDQLTGVLHVQFPAILPELVGGLRVTSALAIGITIVAEYLAAPTGIGRVMKYALSYSSIDLLFVGIVWSVTIAVLADLVIVLVAARLLRWTTRRPS